MTSFTRGMPRRLVLGAAAAAGFGLAAPASAQAPQFFRIGTGAAGGTYYPVGGMIANAISCPPGAPCREAGGTAGVPGLVAVAQATQGSVQNVNLIQLGAAESGFSQSDVAHWAYTGTGLFEGRPKLDRLRFIAHLFGEQLHAVVRRDSPIQRLEDLRGRRVVVGLQASGARIGSELVLEAAGLRGAYTPEFLSAAQGVERMQDRGVDAVLQVVAAPAAAFTEFCSRAGCRLLPFSDTVIQAVSQRAPFYSRGVIAKGTYEGVTEDVPTLSVGAVWLVGAQVPETLVYEITKSLWSETTKSLLQRGHVRARDIVAETALLGRGEVPFHPGAERFYREAGMLR